MHDYAQLRKDLPHGQVLLPMDAGYEASLRRWSTACEKRAEVVVKPASAEEVSTTVQFAVANKVPLTVCGGGHSSSGTSSSEDMVIDLGAMRAVSVNEAEMTVTFEGGCLWEDVDSALERMGLATVGGVVNHTGVGGLILGGGHGYLTPLHGLTIDNLISAQVVLADGSIVEASENGDADLFWAIRGAGAQFGVVTRFVSRVHKQGEVWSGVLVYSPNKLPQLVAAANDLHDRQTRDGHCLALGFGYGPDGRTHTISAIPCYHGPEADGKKYFSRLLELESIADNTRLMSIAQMNTLLNPISGHGLRRLMGSSTAVMPLDTLALQHSVDRFWGFCDKHAAMSQSVLAIEFFPTHRLRAVSQDATAYANRGDYYDAMTLLGWADAELDAEVRTFNRALCEHVRTTNGYRCSDSGGGPVGKYINLEAERIAPRDAYGANLERLRSLKRRYDPRNVFHKWHGLEEGNKWES